MLSDIHPMLGTRYVSEALIAAVAHKRHAATPPMSVMNSRRRMAPPDSRKIGSSLMAITSCARSASHRCDEKAAVIVENIRAQRRCRPYFVDAMGSL